MEKLYTFTSILTRGKSHRRGEEGYTLVALLALMTILMLFALAAAPNVRQQSQRELETEAIFRGEEVAEAIRLYAQAHGNRLPTSMDQLLEGIPRGTKKIQILRPEATRDPLTKSGEWRLIRPRTQTMLEFQRAVQSYAGGTLPNPTDPVRLALQNNYAPKLVNVVDTGAKETAQGGEDDSVNTTGEFIGVASRSKHNSIINYYGIDRHDQWIFTPLFR